MKSNKYFYFCINNSILLDFVKSIFKIIEYIFDFL
jgi:hypothetical protein